MGRVPVLRALPCKMHLHLKGQFTKSYGIGLILGIDRLLDMTRLFTLFDKKAGKIVARYQQVFGIKALIERINTFDDSGAREGGVIWHTQGSGKSLTMVFLAVKMRRDPILKEYKLVFITDRKQLDGQLTATFERTQGETVHHAKKVSELKELLKKEEPMP